MPGPELSTIGRSQSPRLTYAVLGTVVMGFGLMQTLVIPVLPAIQAGLHTTQTSATWLITSYLLSASVSTPILGRLGDMFGRDRLLLVAIGNLALGSLLAGLANSIGLMIAGRAVAGLGGGVIPLAFGIVREEFPREKMASVVGGISAVAAGGSGLGIVIGGPIVQALNFHWLFFIPMLALVVGGVAARLVVPPSRSRTGGRVNLVAAVLLSSWLLALLLGISQAPQWGWGSSREIGLLAGAGVLAATWVLVEEHSTYPLIDMRLMRLRTVWSANLVAVLLGASLYAPFAFLPAYLQTHPARGYGFGASVTASGLIMSPAGVFSFLFGVVAGSLTRRFGAKVVLAFAMASTAGSFVMLATALAAVWQVVAAMAIAGMGNGLAFASLSALVVQGVPASQTSVAAGMNANIRTIGGAIGATALSSIVSAGVRAGALPPKSGYVHGFAAMAACCVGSTLMCASIPRLARPAPEPPHAHDELVERSSLVGREPG